MLMLHRPAIFVHSLSQHLEMLAFTGLPFTRLVMQRQHCRSRLDRRGLALVILFRAPSVDVAASNVSEQRYTRTLAKTPDPSS